MKRLNYFFFYKIMTFSNLEFFQVLSTEWQVSNWLETLHSYYRHIEDVRLLFWMKNGGGIGEEGNRGTDMRSTGASFMSYRQKK